MILIYILIILIGLFCWLLFSPVVFCIDTRIPKAELKWISIGKVLLLYEDEWWLSFRIFFFRKKIRLASIMTSQKAITAKTEKKKRKADPAQLFKKFVRVMKTFKVQKWQLGIDTGSYINNAWLYPVNFLPYCYGHVYVNFTGENYFFIQTRNSSWKILFAYLR